VPASGRISTEREAYEPNEKQVIAEERDLIVSLAVSKSERNRMLTGSLLVAKRHLPAESKVWVLAQVSRQVKRSVSNERAAWEIVRRTVFARNGSEGGPAAAGVVK